MAVSAKKSKSPKIINPDSGGTYTFAIKQGNTIIFTVLADKMDITQGGAAAFYNKDECIFGVSPASYTCAVRLN